MRIAFTSSQNARCPIVGRHKPRRPRRPRNDRPKGRPKAAKYRFHLPLPSAAPTDPFDELLNPARVKRGAKVGIDLVCPLLRELVNYSSHVVPACAEVITDRDAFAPLVLHYQVVEMADAAQELLAL